MLGCWGGGQGEALLTPSAGTLHYGVSLSGPFPCQPRGPMLGLLLVPMALESLCLSLSSPLGQGLLTLLRNVHRCLSDDSLKM